MTILTSVKKISPGARRHVRRQKARIRREYAHTNEIKKHIEKLYARFGIDKTAPSGTKSNQIK